MMKCEETGARTTARRQKTEASGLKERWVVYSLCSSMDQRGESANMCVEQKVVCFEVLRESTIE